MAKCLVTGHKGYIGSRLYKKLKELGHEVMGIDLKEEVPHNIIKDMAEGSDGEFHPHYYNFQPEYIFHMACWPRVGFSIEDPVSTMKNNVIAGTVLLNFAKKCKSVKRVIYSSSSSVVGNGNGPTNPYALHKLTTEMEMGIYSLIYGLDTVSLRYFNVYSEDQKASGPYATAVAHWIHSLKNGIKPYITGDGEQRRDMVHVEDVVAANIFAMNYEKDFKGQAYDVGTGDNISLNEIKKIIQNKHDVEFDYVDPRPGKVMMTRARTFPLRYIGWSTKISIEEGIKRCFDFEVKNER
jgi:UDP-glucose 4-epimerase